MAWRAALSKNSLLYARPVLMVLIYWTAASRFASAFRPKKTTVALLLPGNLAERAIHKLKVSFPAYRCSGRWDVQSTVIVDGMYRCFWLMPVGIGRVLILRSDDECHFANVSGRLVRHDVQQHARVSAARLATTRRGCRVPQFAGMLRDRSSSPGRSPRSKSLQIVDVAVRFSFLFLAEST